MKRLCILSAALVVLPACSGDDTSPNNNANDAAAMDSSLEEASPPAEDTGTPEDTGSPKADTGAGDTGSPADAGAADADAGAADADSGEPDSACPTSWFVTPVVDPSIAVPDGGGGLLLHFEGSGTQDYMCKVNATDAGAPYTWQLLGPDAVLLDCHNNVVGHHFPSEAGANFPEWQTTDGTFVIGTKKVPFTPDGGSGSVAWLLLAAVDGGGSGALSMTDFVQRLNTDGGVAPATGCSADGGDVGQTTNVGYTADYYFYGP